MDALAELEAYVAGLNDQEKKELDGLLAHELNAPWLPSPLNEPQVKAFYSPADVLLFGGAAGGGKTDLLIGAAISDHHRAVIFRRQAVDLRGIEERIIEIAGRDGWNAADKVLRRSGRILELGHLEKPGAELGWQGRPHDFIGFDEGAQLAVKKVRFVMGWLRSARDGQRRRVVIASNPPTGGEGEWLIEWFAPWLNPQFSNPAIAGELRWAITATDIEGTTIWVKDNSPVVFTGQLTTRKATAEEIERGGDDVIFPLSRTFIPSRLSDNPYLSNTGYRAQLQSLPEPLRSQLLNGDFVAGRKDHEWQVIPSGWVKDAQARWTPRPPDDAVMTAIGVDVAQGGSAKTTLAPRHGPWYAPIIAKPGSETPKPSDVAGLVVSNRHANAVVIVDVGGGYGGGVKERLQENNIDVIGFNGAGTSSQRTLDKHLTFVNKRAEAHWRFREALDPDQEHGSPIALPPDPELLADLTAVRWKLSAGGIQIEDKKEIAKPERLGRSPDKGDAVVMAWSEGQRALIARQKRARPKPNPLDFSRSGDTDGTAWLGR